MSSSAKQTGGYVANVPDLEFCSAFGETPEEALAAVREAKELWLQTTRDLGRPIPEPLYKPATS